MIIFLTVGLVVLICVFRVFCCIKNDNDLELLNDLDNKKAFHKEIIIAL